MEDFCRAFYMIQSQNYACYKNSPSMTTLIQLIVDRLEKLESDEQDFIKELQSSDRVLGVDTLMIDAISRKTCLHRKVKQMKRELAEAAESPEESTRITKKLSFFRWELSGVERLVAERKRFERGRIHYFGRVEFVRESLMKLESRLTEMQERQAQVQLGTIPQFIKLFAIPLVIREKIIQLLEALKTVSKKTKAAIEKVKFTEEQPWEVTIFFEPNPEHRGMVIKPWCLDMVSGEQKYSVDWKCLFHVDIDRTPENQIYCGGIPFQEKLKRRRVRMRLYASDDTLSPQACQRIIETFKYCHAHG